MQSVVSRIWTCVAMSISYDDNHYTTGTFKTMDYRDKWRERERGRESEKSMLAAQLDDYDDE